MYAWRQTQRGMHLWLYMHYAHIHKIILHILAESNHALVTAVHQLHPTRKTAPKDKYTVHTYIHTYMHTYIETHAYAYTYPPTCPHTCIHTFIHAYLNTYMGKVQLLCLDQILHASRRSNHNVNTYETHVNILLASKIARHVTFMFMQC